jgi:hypothetical protein
VVIKNPEFIKLQSYTSPPPKEFWESFPSNHPQDLKKTVNVEN